MTLYSGGKHKYRTEKNRSCIGASKEVGPEVNPEKIMYMVLSRYWKAGQEHGKKIANRPFEDVAEFTYLGTTLTHQN
jgi:hypothetical protein